ncbi:MAG: phosphohistidine phosphatase SixA [Verrucomicrobia bacterium]|nr:phosphohistidine phosphatase SixA [Verrucomicrobiota bacterium]MBU1909494.1 phosphohistidine phosphatase SixA [Verrucomicrobiota bacterium]
MKLLLVRHAAAVEPAAFPGPDLERPLTAEGKKKARRVVKVLSALYPELEVILTSCARRAVETGEILAQGGKKAKLLHSERLNPGCDIKDLGRALADLPKQPSCVAIVGHEPDLSRILAHMAGAGTLRVEFKKAACAEVEINQLLKGELKALLPPSALLHKGKAE